MGARLPISLLVVAIMATACSASGGQAAARYDLATNPAPLPAAVPDVVMTNPQKGWAVWPSGESWLVLETDDGFAHVTNRTPVAVETDGGLVGSFELNTQAVAVGAHERLTRSPLLVATGTSAWHPAELPAAVSNTRGAVSIGAAGATVLTDTGALVKRGTSGWASLADVGRLAPAGGLHLDTITWASASRGWITAHGTPGQPMAFDTDDGGATWAPVPQTSGSTVAVLAPCGHDGTWVLPVLDRSATTNFLRTDDAGVTWVRGAALHTARGVPAWGCAGTDVWSTASTSGGDHVFASDDSGASWVDRRPAPHGLTALTPTGGGSGVAASGGHHPVMWSVTGDGTRFTTIPLPGWVATIGGPSGGR